MEGALVGTEVVMLKLSLFSRELVGAACDVDRGTAALPLAPGYGKEEYQGMWNGRSCMMIGWSNVFVVGCGKSRPPIAIACSRLTRGHVEKVGKKGQCF